MSHHFAKPENALRKALDLVKVNKDDAALRILHSMLLTRRYRTWQPTHEEIMMLYVKLAVDNRKNAKDGLLQYRNICQVQQVDSLEKVIKEFLRLAEAKAAEVEVESEVIVAEVPSAAPTKIAPLDEAVGFRPEVVHFFVQGVGGDDDADRSKRELVTPWLRYLWDTYRTVLDVMRNNQQMDKLYHRIVRKALAYCTTHQRTSEFRRLCEIMRIHLNAIVTYQGQPNSVDISSPETVQAYLRTRFSQLECASSLDLWQEAYRIIEDIHELLLRSKIDIGLDQSLLSNYYQKLELIFWKSGNTLFHAYCVEKRHAFAVAHPTDAAEHGETATVSEITDRLVIASLAIPLQPEGATLRVSNFDADDQKNLRLASMLGFSGPPSRMRIIELIGKKNIEAHASPAVVKLFKLLTGKIVSPRALTEEARPLLEEIGQQPHLAQYTSMLSKGLALVTLQQCARIYTVLRIQSFMQLLPEGFSPADIEQLIIIWVKSQLIRVRIDHTNDRLSFESAALSTDGFREQLPRLAQSLQLCLDKVHPICAAEREVQRIRVFQLVKQGMDHDHRDVFIRKQVIEKRKQETELATQRREREDLIRTQQLKQRKLEDEHRRLLEEKNRREREREERAEKERVIAINMAMLEKLKLAAAAAGGGESTTVRSRKIIETLEENFETVDHEKLMEAQSEVQSQEQRAKEKKLRDDHKRLEYLTRAMRIEEKPLLIEKLDRQRVEDESYYEEQWQKHVVAHKAKHETNVSDKARLARMLRFKAEFQGEVMKVRQSIHDEEVGIFEEKVRQMEAERSAELKRLAALEAERERLAEVEEQKRAVIAAEEAKRDAVAQEERARKAAADQERLEKLNMQAERQRKREKELEEQKLEKQRVPVRMTAPTAAPAQPSTWRRDEPVAAPVTSAATGTNAAWKPSREGGWRSKVVAEASGAPAPSGRDLANLRDRETPAAPSDAPAEAAAGGAQAPRLRLANAAGKPSWRDRQAAADAPNKSGR